MKFINNFFGGGKYFCQQTGVNNTKYTNFVNHPSRYRVSMALVLTGSDGEMVIYRTPLKPLLSAFPSQNRILCDCKVSKKYPKIINLAPKSHFQPSKNLIYPHICPPKSTKCPNFLQIFTSFTPLDQPTFTTNNNPIILHVTFCNKQI